ncbi:DUF3099 domain-containing protein [Corynebacterium uberis]|uniref:DUF3099 domain-containing protein n=1 Tax=Corynebacterium TaxID=1716 RepID=UPI001D0B8054|nr:MULTISPECIES: DUF3099 domain-containing protein [Corynebacterium]MCZ9308512.1 DUF3099 domain-containing protein [Corynebacterium sp. c6VSa_13]UDL74168.1 DUF3099 domain-containing protein [Corynebacterium uberis]UDL74948.1 DUF3099 domain-containing protein [Corynebacterium uberis]UDL77163.1 DUF3099 domain-containing protein [Corynebacterium uberis]UDL79445.1 DUF3099 domain-containing protein [Corynebacterium uberis]
MTSQPGPTPPDPRSAASGRDHGGAAQDQQQGQQQGQQQEQQSPPSPEGPGQQRAQRAQGAQAIVRDRSLRSWLRPFRRAELITDAHRTPSQNRRHRERVYAVIQGIRLPLIVVSLAIYSLAHNPGLAGALFFISIPLPWIAVVIANGRGEPRDRRAPQVYKPAVARELYERQTQLNAAQRRELGTGSPDE